LSEGSFQVSFLPRVKLSKKALNVALRFDKLKLYFMEVLPNFFETKLKVGNSLGSLSFWLNDTLSCGGPQNPLLNLGQSRISMRWLLKRGFRNAGTSAHFCLCDIRSGYDGRLQVGFKRFHREPYAIDDIIAYGDRVSPEPGWFG